MSRNGRRLAEQIASAEAELAAPVTTAAAAAAITKLAREQGLPGPPFWSDDWMRLAREVGWIITPAEDPDTVIVFSKETLTAEERLSELSAQANETREKLAQALSRAHVREEWQFDEESGKAVNVPIEPAITRVDDAAASPDAEVQELAARLSAIEAEHAVLAGRLTRLRQRDLAKHELRRSGPIGKVRTALKG